MREIVCGIVVLILLSDSFPHSTEISFREGRRFLIREEDAQVVTIIFVPDQESKMIIATSILYSVRNSFIPVCSHEEYQKFSRYSNN